MSRTSMACPFIAGIIALMLDADDRLGHNQVKSILYAPGNVKNFGPPGKDIDFGHGVSLGYYAIKQAGNFLSEKAWADGLSMNYTSGSLSGLGSYIQYPINVTTTRPIGITMVMPYHAPLSQNFSLHLYDPSGNLVASSQGLKRQEQILYQPVVTGTYQVRITSAWGSGSFWCNVSWR